MPKLTQVEQWMLGRMREGFEPFPMQAPNAFRSLEKKGLVKADYDDEGRLVARLTEEGRKAETDRPSESIGPWIVISIPGSEEDGFDTAWASWNPGAGESAVFGTRQEAARDAAKRNAGAQPASDRRV